MTNLTDRKIAILTENGFEEVELTGPKKALEDAGAKVDVISPQKGKVKAMKHHEWSIEVPVDKHISEVKAEDYDALMLPGGVINPDQLRLDPKAIEFIKNFFDAGKPVAAICHGLQSLISARVLAGRKVTSYPAIQIDVENAGALWIDRPVVVDQGLVTSRTPEDLPAFNKKMCEEFAEAKVELSPE